LLPRDGTRLRAQHTHTHIHTHTHTNIHTNIHTTSTLGPGQTCQRGISIPAANAVAIRLTDPWRSRSFAPRSEIIRRSQSTHASTNASPSNVNSDGDSDVDSDGDGDDPHRYRYELYQYKICPFSNMAKAYLEYQRIPYRSIEVNPLTKTELGFSKDYRKVPIVRIIDTDPLRAAEGAVQQLNGTEEILAHQSPNATLGGGAATAATAEGPSFAESESSLRWQDFARTRLAPLLYPNLCKSLGDSFRAFGYVHDDNHDGTGSNSFSLAQRLSIQCVGSVAMYFAASKILQKYEIDDAERALADVLTELEEALVSSRSAFLGGSGTGPELGDLAIYGVFKGLEGLPLFASVFEPETRAETQAETPTSYRYPMLRDWYAAVGAAVEERRLQTPRYGYND